MKSPPSSPPSRLHQRHPQQSCPHLTSRQMDAMTQHYRLLAERIIFPLADSDSARKASLTSNSTGTNSALGCARCADPLNSMLCCCFECPTVGCLDHLQGHMNESGHLFGLSLHFGELYCARCTDFVYHWKSERLRRYAHNAQRKRLGLSQNASWNPGRTEMKLLLLHQRVHPNNAAAAAAVRSPPRMNSSNLKVMRLGVNGTRGLRGLVNLGNTCFMNCIIQTLTHIPMLRDYFLSDQHHCQHQVHGLNNEHNKCLMCELSHIFQEFYGGKGPTAPIPYVPHRMLHLVWTHAEHLAGYEQHDAHEFLISALNVLHKHSEGVSGAAKFLGNQAQTKCNCIIDRLFTGQLQSDLTCTKCGRVSTTVDPYWDISLELSSAGQQQQQVQQKQPITTAAAEEKETPSPTTVADSSSDTQLSATSSIVAAPAMVIPSGGGEKTLNECLENFVKVENLVAHSKTKCDHCGTYEESTKQLTLRKLPIIACFHLKRFEHTAAARRKKIKDTVKYPEFIDLTPYTTAERRKTNSEVLDGAPTSSAASSSSSQEQLARLRNRYSLIAVVNHNGTTESGHYSCYIRHQRRQWYKCNDQVISRETVDKVLKSEGYLLFYCKMFIDYD